MRATIVPVRAERYAGSRTTRVIRWPALDTSHHRPAATIAIVTFVVLVLELTSTRLYAYIGSYHATSTALSIAVLGIGIGAFVRLRFPRSGEPRIVAPALAAALFCVAAATTAGASLPVLVALSLVPFALAGMLVSDAYASRGHTRARATYAIDLLGAAAGCLVAPRLLGPLSPTEITTLLGIMCCALALMLVERRRRSIVAVALIAVANVSLFIAARASYLPDGPLDALLRSDLSEKAMSDSRTTARDVLDVAWSPLGRLDVHRAPQDREATLGVFTDGMSPTYLVQQAHAKATAFENTWGLLMSLPYRAWQPKRVLVLGAGAGASVWLAKKYGASRVDAVEVNPAIPDVLARWKHFAGDVYQQPGVRLFIEDARRYLTDTTERYDLIELALALTGNVHAQPSGMEAHLYTIEAVELYLRRLSPTGALVLIHSDPGNAYRQLLTVIAALESIGVPRERALEGIAVLHDPRPAIAYRYMLVVRTSPMPLDDVDLLDVPPAELLWGPGDPVERRAQLLDRTRLGATDDDDLTPVRDERPYFFQNTKGLTATALAEPGRLWVLAGALVLVLVLMFERGARGSSVRPAVAATVLGAAYFCVELALIQRFTLAAGGALYAVSFVLFGVLAWSAVGALLLGGVWRRLDRGVSIASVAAALAVATTALVVRDVAWLDEISSDGLRMLLIAAMVAPVGLAIGGPFPTLLAQHGDPDRRIATLWAINGAASVAGGIVAVLALRVAGSTDTLLLGAGLYVAAAAIAPRKM
jgi:SAM-dependent methyltransferase